MLQAIAALKLEEAFSFDFEIQQEIEECHCTMPFEEEEDPSGDASEYRERNVSASELTLLVHDQEESVEHLRYVDADDEGSRGEEAEVEKGKRVLLEAEGATLKKKNSSQAREI